jgi:hypothetical protein
MEWDNRLILFIAPSRRLSVMLWMLAFPGIETRRDPSQGAH